MHHTWMRCQRPLVLQVVAIGIEPRVADDGGEGRFGDLADLQIEEDQVAGAGGARLPIAGATA